MPTFKLDGVEVPFEQGDTILRAAWRQGLEIPHYCWHPGLSVAANCRMCLVELKTDKPMLLPILKWDAGKKEYVPATKPKLHPACQTPPAEGMEVMSAASVHARDAQEYVHESLLLNHPVDCPICDQAGECKLQDYWYAHQAKHKRKFTEPVHKPKAQSFGPTIVYDAERCVMCTRCIRFCQEVVGDHVLDMRQRGNKNEVVLAQGRELDHKYSLMTEHVCPVGALTSREFRFKARVWFLRSAPGVCTGCATGCNTHVDYDPRYQRVYRLRPRDNMDVNKFWMCDDGMLTYRAVHEGRILAAREGRGAAREELGHAEALRRAGELLGRADGARTAGVLSAQSSTEDNVAMARFARETLKTTRIFLAALGGWDGDKILRNADNNPNRAGALKAAGGAAAPVSALLAEVAAGRVDTVVVLGSCTGERPAELGVLERATVITLAANDGPLAEEATLLLPIASWAESDGSFTNAARRTQEFRRAIAPAGGVRDGWQVVGAIAEAMGRPLGFKSIRDVRGLIENAPAAGSEVRA